MPVYLCVCVCLFVGHTRVSPRLSLLSVSLFPLSLSSLCLSLADSPPRNLPRTLVVGSIPVRNRGGRRHRQHREFWQPLPRCASLFLRFLCFSAASFRFLPSPLAVALSLSSHWLSPSCPSHSLTIPLLIRPADHLAPARRSGGGSERPCRGPHRRLCQCASLPLALRDKGREKERDLLRICGKSKREREECVCLDVWRGGDAALPTLSSSIHVPPSY